MGVLVPSARYRKGHYAYGKFTVPQPHGLHTDHSAEDPAGAGEPICIARIETLGTHYLAGDYKAYDPETQSMLKALRYWIAVPEGEPENILDELLKRQTLKTIPVNRVMLMVAGNSSENTQVTQHIAARPPDGGLHSAFSSEAIQAHVEISVGRPPGYRMLFLASRSLNERRSITIRWWLPLPISSLPSLADTLKSIRLPSTPTTSAVARDLVAYRRGGEVLYIHGNTDCAFAWHPETA